MMRIGTMILSCALLFTPAVSATQAPTVAQVHKITPEEAKLILDGSDPYILLDVRTEVEFREQRIEGAVLIPDYELEARAADELPDHDALILVYCRSGRRSANAANALVRAGYTNVCDFGGIIDWPYDTVSGD